MLNRLTRYSVLILLSSIIISCGVTPSLTSVDSDKELKKTELLNSWESENIDWDWLIIKAKVKLESKELRGSASAQIRMRKDSLIWIHITKASIEGARVLITPDSLFAIDRMNKQYLKESLTAISDKYGIPAGFDCIQALILGDLMYDYSEESDFELQKDFYHIRESEEDLQHSAQFSKVSLLLLMQSVIHPREGHLIMRYNGYEAQEGFRSLATHRSLEIEDRRSELYFCEVKNIRARWNQAASTRFSIPGHYDQMSF